MQEFSLQLSKFSHLPLMKSAVVRKLME